MESPLNHIIADLAMYKLENPLTSEVPIHYRCFDVILILLPLDETEPAFAKFILIIVDLILLWKFLIIKLISLTPKFLSLMRNVSLIMCFINLLDLAGILIIFFINR